MQYWFHHNQKRDIRWISKELPLLNNKNPMLVRFFWMSCKKSSRPTVTTVTTSTTMSLTLGSLVSIRRMVRGPHPGRPESPESREQTKAMEPKDSVQERDLPKLTEIFELTKVSEKYCVRNERKCTKAREPKDPAQERDLSRCKIGAQSVNCCGPQ